jgi:hypothetical protein
MEEFRVPFNKLIYESFEDALQSNINKLVKDIANTLEVDPKILLIELKKEKILTYLIEEDYPDIDDMKCKYYDKKANIYVPCDEPVIFKKDHCVGHMNYRISKSQIPKDTLELRVLTLKNIKYYRDSDNRVLDSLFKPIGYFEDDTNILYEFEVNNV